KSEANFVLFTGSYGLRRAGLHLFSGVLDGFDDVLVASAAADVAFQPFTDLGLCRIRVILQQLIRGHNHTRCAESTLQTMFLPERLLNRMQAALWSKTLDSHDLTAIGLHG